MSASKSATAFRIPTLFKLKSIGIPAADANDGEPTSMRLSIMEKAAMKKRKTPDASTYIPCEFILGSAAEVERKSGHSPTAL